MDSKIRPAAKLLQIKTRTGAETCTGYGVVIVFENKGLQSDLLTYI